MRAIHASLDRAAGVPVPLTTLVSQHKTVALQRLTACGLRHAALCRAVVDLVTRSPTVNRPSRVVAVSFRRRPAVGVYL